jgi:hypothetical protein
MVAVAVEATIYLHLRQETKSLFQQLIRLNGGDEMAKKKGRGPEDCANRCEESARKNSATEESKSRWRALSRI